MLLIGTLAAALAFASADDDVWARFSAHHALSRLNIDVEIGFVHGTGDEPVYWIRRRIQRPRQKPQTSRVDTQSCPQMLTALKSLHDLPMPRANLLFLDPTYLIADGTGYSLTIPAAYPSSPPGELTLNSNVGTPLADWIEDALATLDSCMPK